MVHKNISFQLMSTCESGFLLREWKKGKGSMKLKRQLLGRSFGELVVSTIKEKVCQTLLWTGLVTFNIHLNISIWNFGPLALSITHI